MTRFRFHSGWDGGRHDFTANAPDPAAYAAALTQASAGSSWCEVLS